VRRSKSVPRALRTPLESVGGRCYRHCDRPVRLRRVRSTLPGIWHIRACPSGIVSVTSYAEWGRSDPTESVRRTLRRWTVPPSLVRSWDLRTATRHGPELGRSAERFMLHSGSASGVRVVYWRVYPFRARDGTERRLFVCFRRSHSGPVFFAGSPASETRECPVCSVRARRPRRGSPGRSAPAKRR